MLRVPLWVLAAQPLIAISTSLLLVSCCVGPDYNAPEPPKLTRATAEPLPPQTDGASSQRLVQGDVPERWWTLFQSPRIDALVEQALKANPELQAAEAALRQAHESYLAQRGALFPTVDVGASTTRQKDSAYLSPTLSTNTTLFSLQTAQVNVGYTLDLFGGIRRATEQAKAQADAQRYETEAAYVTLTSNVVAAAIQEAALRDQAGAARELVGLNRQALKVLQDQLAVGQVARADVAAQEAALAQAEAALAPLDKQLAQQQDLLAALIGGYPESTPATVLRLSDLKLPQDVPVSLPAQILRRRPDVQAAEANVHAASAAVGVAIANRLPQFTIGGTAGGAATQWGQLLSNGNGLWSVSAGVAQPVFQGGALLHRQKAAEAALDQAKAQYRSAVVSAVQNVADALEALKADARALDAAVVTEDRAKESLTIAKGQLDQGAISGFALIQIEQAYAQARQARVQAEGARLADTAALIQALGGDWWRRERFAAAR
jgi:NodT family efflux transporter outer membrane factor (OMF) lipoprotein